MKTLDDFKKTYSESKQYYEQKTYKYDHWRTMDIISCVESYISIADEILEEVSEDKAEKLMGALDLYPDSYYYEREEWEEWRQELTSLKKELEETLSWYNEYLES